MFCKKKLKFNYIVSETYASKLYLCTRYVQTIESLFLIPFKFDFS